MKKSVCRLSQIPTYPFDPKFRRSSYESQPQKEDIMFVEAQEPSSSRWHCPYEAWGDSRSSYQGLSPSGGAQPARHTVLLWLPPPVSTMDPNPRARRLLVLNAAIKAMDLAKEASSATPATAVFGSVGVILMTHGDPSKIDAHVHHGNSMFH